MVSLPCGKQQASIHRPSMRQIVLLIALYAATRVSAEVQFLGVMGDSRQTYFALRADETAATKWLRVGETLGRFTVASYDAEIEALTLRDAGQSMILRMPAARVRMAIDEVTVGLSKILNLPGAKDRRDLLHPALRPLFKDSDLNVFDPVLETGTINSIQPLTEEEKKFLEEGLSAVEKIVGTRPSYGLWTKTKTSHAMSFVVNVGDAWYLAPGVPGLTDALK